MRPFNLSALCWYLWLHILYDEKQSSLASSSISYHSTQVILQMQYVIIWWSWTYMWLTELIHPTLCIKIHQINCSKFLHASFCFLSSFLVFSLIKTWPCMYCTSHWPLTSKFIVLMGLYSRAFKLDNWEVQTFFWICQNMIFYLRKAVTVILLK